jgi:hypothetical protein
MSGDEWCGRLALSGTRAPASGERVTMVVNVVRTDAGDSVEIGTVVPPEFQVTP